jgi:hypothetical protein
VIASGVPTRYNIRVNRRQRRKRHLGEFVQYGFEVKASFVDGASLADESFWKAADDFFAAQSLCFSGGGNRIGVFWWVVGERRNGHGRVNNTSATDEDRALVLRWLLTRPELHEASVGALEVNC